MLSAVVASRSGIYETEKGPSPVVKKWNSVLTIAMAAATVAQLEQLLM
ncbi:hypothetical protein [Aminobacterium mobile]